MLEKLAKNLCCNICHGELRFSDQSVYCMLCRAEYPIVNDTPLFLSSTNFTEESIQPIGDPLIYRWKVYFKKYNRLYYILVKLLGALFVGRKNGLQACASFSNDALILNIGSGPKKLAEHITNIDFYPFNGVALVANAAALPFKTSSVDAVICECLLEHVTNPVAIVTELERVLKVGGLIYVSVPFIDAYHSSPDDYYRWTRSGIRELLKNFEERELCIGWGPTSALITVLSHWLALLFSLGTKTMYQLLLLFFMVIFAPLKLVDYVFRDNVQASNIADGFYYIGVKK